MTKPTIEDAQRATSMMKSADDLIALWRGTVDVDTRLNITGRKKVFNSLDRCDNVQYLLSSEGREAVRQAILVDCVEQLMAIRDWLVEHGFDPQKLDDKCSEYEVSAYKTEISETKIDTEPVADVRKKTFYKGFE